MNIAEALAELEIDADASEATLRARYRELVKQHSPDRDPERFQRIRRAYELASDPHARAREIVTGPAPYAAVHELLQDLRRQPREPLGLTGWLEVMKS